MGTRVRHGPSAVLEPAVPILILPAWRLYDAIQRHELRDDQFPDRPSYAARRAPIGRTRYRMEATNAAMTSRMSVITAELTSPRTMW
jgi:hypothetical protein